MSIDPLTKSLARLPLFAGLKPIQISEIARRSGRMVFGPGDTITMEGLDAPAAIVIAAGEAVRLNPRDLSEPHEMIPPGSMVSELAMLVETVHAVTVVASSSVRALIISRADMHEMMTDDLSLASHLSEHIIARLHSIARDMRGLDDDLSRVQSARDDTTRARLSIGYDERQHPGIV